MLLLDLPVDVFHKILVCSVISRGVARGLRLKLVCKCFCACVQLALFETRLLDDFVPSVRINNGLNFLESWYVRRTYGAEKLWHSYLVYRVQNERDPGRGRFVELRQVIERICQETEADYAVTLDALCWLGLERVSCAPGFNEGWNINPHDRISKTDKNLLSAAAYLGDINLARKLLKDDHCPTMDGVLFPAPLQAAAWAGHADMLQVLQEHLPEYEETAPHASQWRQNWRAKTGPGSIKGAVMLGDMEILRLAVYPTSRSSEDKTAFVGQQFGHVDPLSNPGLDLHAALHCVKTWEMFKYIDSFFSKSALSSEEESAVILARYTELGNTEMVRHILETGVDINGKSSMRNYNPLVIASRYGHEDIVDLLLERGAEADHSKLQAGAIPLRAATCAGSISIVRKLLARGASFASLDWEPILIAFQLEHTALIDLILGLHQWSKEELESMARRQRKMGLDSVASFLLSKRSSTQ